MYGLNGLVSAVAYVKEECTVSQLSPYLFAVYIDNLVDKVTSCGYGHRHAA